MAHITKDELIKIAQISQVRLHEKEIPALAEHVEGVLNYSARVQEAATQAEDMSTKAINVMREDVVKPSTPDAILAAAPQVDHHYLVVPKVIDS